MDTWYAQADAAWAAAGWNDAPGGGGTPGTPTTGDTCDLNGHTVDAPAAIPCNVGGSGTLNISADLDSAGSYLSCACVITAGTISNTHFSGTVGINAACSFGTNVSFDNAVTQVADVHVLTGQTLSFSSAFCSLTTYSLIYLDSGACCTFDSGASLTVGGSVWPFVPADSTCSIKLNCTISQSSTATFSVAGGGGGVYPAEANVSTVETGYGPTGTEYAGSLNLGLYVLASGIVWPAEANVSDVETAWGPTGDEYAGSLDLDLYTLISGVAGADDVRAATPRYSGGPNGNLIVPAAADLGAGVHAGWHHTGTPDTYEITGTGTLLTPSSAGQATGVLYCYSSAGVLAAGIVVCVQETAVASGDTIGHAYSGAIRQITSDAGGLVQVPNMWRGATYNVWIGSETPKSCIVPGTGESFSLPTLLGNTDPGTVQKWTSA